MNINGDSDETCIQRGAERFLRLKESQGRDIEMRLVNEMGQRLLDRGWQATPNAIMHVAGNVSDAEWDAAVERIPR